jgi:beta-lactamase superfamily II metal-dependent hydrolase
MSDFSRERLMYVRLIILAILWIPAWLHSANPPPSIPTSLASVSLDETKLRVHFIDIGPGLAMLIETPGDRKHIFVDGGKWGLTKMMAYLDRFIGTDDVDIAIVTHPDFDHFSGVKKIFRKYDVGQFWSTGYTSDKLSAANSAVHHF